MNPYVEHFMEQGYDRQDCQGVSTTRTFPLTIHGRTFETEDEYYTALHDFMNGQ